MPKVNRDVDKANAAILPPNRQEAIVIDYG